MEGRRLGLKTFKPNNPTLMRGLESCIRLGSTALVEDLGEEVDPALQTILQNQGVQQVRAHVHMGAVVLAPRYWHHAAGLNARLEIVPDCLCHSASCPTWAVSAAASIAHSLEPLASVKRTASQLRLITPSSKCRLTQDAVHYLSPAGCILLHLDGWQPS